MPTLSRAIAPPPRPPPHAAATTSRGPAVDGVPAKTALSPHLRSGSREDKGSGSACNEFAMVLPLMPAAAGRGSGWPPGNCRAAWAALVVVAALGVGSTPGLAEEPDPFSATVAIDATAETVVKARETARLDGQRRALTAIVEHLSSGAAAGNGPNSALMN